MNTLLRVLGVILPLALAVPLYGSSGEWVLVALAAEGFIGGALIRAWWSVAAVPIVVVGMIEILAVILMSGTDGAARDPLGVLVLLVLPVAIGAALGTLNGTDAC